MALDPVQLALVAVLVTGVADLLVTGYARRRVEAQLVHKITTSRQAAQVWVSRRPLDRDGAAWRLMLPRSVQRRGTDLVASSQTWEADEELWVKHAQQARLDLLPRTKETADRWRNIQAGAVTLLGAALIVDRPTLPPPGSGTNPVLALLLLTLVLALNGVALTGLAAAGMPKMQLDLTGPTALVEQVRLGASSLVRLRTGIASGGLAAVLLVLVAAATLG